jgi:hypothetical protein
MSKEVIIEAAKVPREAPKEIMRQLKNWHAQAILLRAFHLLLSFGAIGTSVTVASRIFDPSSLSMTLIAWATAVTTGVLVYLGLDGKTANMRTAWRILNVAVVRYQTEENFKIEDLNAAYKTGESIIGDVKVNLAK